MFPDPRILIAYATAGSALESYLIVGPLMALLWFYYLMENKASVVDAGWAGSFILISGFMIYSHQVHNPKMILLSVMYLLWSVRLSTYLLKHRVIGQPEDPRYETLKVKWKKRKHFRFFIFFQLQGVLAVILAIPIFIVRFDPHKSIQIVHILALLLWLLSLAGESIADYQLSQFKRNPKNKGKTCRQGLWKYSRHPNYFFEWMIWVSYFIFTLPSPLGSAGLLPPLLMLFFLLRVTGIPATEAQALKSRGQDYKNYQKSTNRFLPWFPQKK